MRSARTKSLLTTLLVASIAAITLGQESTKGFVPKPAKDSKNQDCGLKRGVNIGNALEAPAEGDWGIVIEESFFDKILESGFDHVRLPVSWTYYTGRQTPFKIDPDFLNRVEEIVQQCTRRGLKIIINNHHYHALNQNPSSEKQRAIAIWRQIAERFQNYSNDLVYFEILNEPHDAFDENPALWNQHIASVLPEIRATNPKRWVVVGPVGWNSISDLPKLQLPTDPRLIATVHYYSPHSFTHQGAEWVTPSPATGVDWNGASYGIASGWDNWSWKTVVQPTMRGIEVTYSEGYAGLSLHSKTDIEEIERIEIETNANLPLSIVAVGEDETETSQVSFESSGSMKTYSFSYSEFKKAPQTLRRITLQNTSPASQSSFLVKRISIVHGGKKSQLLATAGDSLALQIEKAAAWAKARNCPIYVGEFGTYHKVDMQARIRWTKAVREACENQQIPWAYWEFAAGFGIYDPESREYRENLLRALIPTSP